MHGRHVRELMRPYRRPDEAEEETGVTQSRCELLGLTGKQTSCRWRVWCCRRNSWLVLTPPWRLAVTDEAARVRVQDMPPCFLDREYCAYMLVWVVRLQAKSFAQHQVTGEVVKHGRREECRCLVGVLCKAGRRVGVSDSAGWVVGCEMR